MEKGQGCAGSWWRLAVVGGAVGRRRITLGRGGGMGRVSSDIGSGWRSPMNNQRGWSWHLGGVRPCRRIGGDVGLENPRTVPLDVAEGDKHGRCWAGGRRTWSVNAGARTWRTPAERSPPGRQRGRCPQPRAGEEVLGGGQAFGPWGWREPMENDFGWRRRMRNH